MPFSQDQDIMRRNMLGLAETLGAEAVERSAHGIDTIENSISTEAETLREAIIVAHRLGVSAVAIAEKCIGSVPYIYMVARQGV